MELVPLDRLFNSICSQAPELRTSYKLARLDQDLIEPIYHPHRARRRMMIGRQTERRD